MKTGEYKDIDGYIALFPKEVQQILQKMREEISRAAPEATEDIRYGIPTYRYRGNLVHFAAYDTHIGFYPTPSGIEAFKEELSKFELGKGTIRFPLDAPIPYDLVRKVVEYRMEESRSGN
ncbi:MAG: iron chaperone [Bacteroidales bacterium]